MQWLDVGTRGVIVVTDLKCCTETGRGLDPGYVVDHDLCVALKSQFTASLVGVSIGRVDWNRARKVVKITKVVGIKELLPSTLAE